MSQPEPPRVGTVCWHDLTVPNADEVRDFYRAVVGWSPQPLEMGGYSDYVMTDPSGVGVAGVCHARGANADLPPVWLVYVAVEDLERSAARCAELGGSVLAGPRSAGGGRFCVIRDPAGAVVGLYQSGPSEGGK
jgi:uncharacterized protein